jgi:hypothetical protein
MIMSNDMHDYIEKLSKLASSANIEEELKTWDEESLRKFSDLSKQGLKELKELVLKCLAAKSDKEFIDNILDAKNDKVITGKEMKDVLLRFKEDSED